MENNQPKYSNNKRRAYYTLGISKFLIILISFIMGACDSCDKNENKEPTTQLQLTADKTSLVGEDRTFILTIKNPKDHAIAINQYKLQGEIKHEEGEKGSTIGYTTAAGEKRNPLSLHEPLDHFLSNTTLEAQETKQIPFTVVPADGVSALMVDLQLYHIENQELVGNLISVTWRAESHGMPIIELEDIVVAKSAHPGNFDMRVQQEDLDPQAVELNLGSNNQASFIFSKNKQSKAKLSDLIDRTATIKAGELVGPIHYELADAQGQNKATITLDCNQKDNLLGSHTLSWNQKDLAVKLEQVSYDPSNQQVTYKINKTGQDMLDDTDDIHFRFNNLSKNKAVIKGSNGSELGKSGYIDITDNNQLSGQLIIDLKGEPKAAFNFGLYHGNALIGKPTQITAVKPTNQKDLRLTFNQVSFNKKESTLTFRINKSGKDLLIPEDQLAFFYKATNKQNKAHINGNQEGQLVLNEAQLADLNNKKSTQLNLSLAFNQEATANFEYGLSVGGQLIGSTQPFDYQLSSLVDFEFTDAAKHIDLQGDNRTAHLSLTNTGTTPSDPNKLALKIRKLSGDNAVLIAGVQIDEGQEKIHSLAYKNLQLNSNETKDLSLAIEPNKGLSATFELQPIYDGRPIGTTKQIEWGLFKQPAQGDIDFEDSAPIQLYENNQKATIHLVNNSEHIIDCQKLTLNITKTAGDDAVMLEGEKIHVGDKISMPLKDLKELANNWKPGFKLDMKELRIKPNGGKSAVFEFQLLTDENQPISSKKTVEWTQFKQPAPGDIAFKDPAPIQLYGDNQKATINLVNNSKHIIDCQKLTLNITKTAGDDAVMIEGEKRNVGDKIAMPLKDLKELANNWKPGQILNMENLAIKPNGGKSAVFEFQLLTNENQPISSKKIVEWGQLRQPAPGDITFKDPATIQLYGDNQKATIHLVNNSGHIIDCQKLTLNITKTAGDDAVMIEGEKRNVGDKIAMPLKDLANSWKPGCTLDMKELLIKPNGGKSAVFEFQLLTNENQPISSKKIVEWGQLKQPAPGDITFKDPATIQLNGDNQEATIHLVNNSGYIIDCQKLTLSISKTDGDDQVAILEEQINRGGNATTPPFKDLKELANNWGPGKILNIAFPIQSKGGSSATFELKLLNDGATISAAKQIKWALEKKQAPGS